jgi:hypothetical protein
MDIVTARQLAATHSLPRLANSFLTKVSHELRLPPSCPKSGHS